ncbi:hypothetical protein [Streptomyces aureus]|uniref:hypothetical protein n=1 Tax=Streptomyces aureus TaxID=193461 RepID=UPI0033DCB538
MEDGQVVGLRVRDAVCSVAAARCVAFLVEETQRVAGEQYFEGAHFRDVGQLWPHLACEEGEVVGSRLITLRLGPRFEHGGQRLPMVAIAETMSSSRAFGMCWMDWPLSVWCCNTGLVGPPLGGDRPRFGRRTPKQSFQAVPLLGGEWGRLVGQFPGAAPNVGDLRSGQRHKARFWSAAPQSAEESCPNNMLPALYRVHRIHIGALY